MRRARRTFPVQDNSAVSARCAVSAFRRESGSATIAASMDRRTLLKTGGLALAGFGLTNCGAATRSAVSSAPRRPPLDLPPVNVSFDRVIRTTVGLRPHRDSGFVLRAEKLDAKTLIHNYGHARRRHVARLGLRLDGRRIAVQTGARRAAVIGCGSPGLTAARQLQRRGFAVTIYATTVPPDTTSNMSLAGFTPTTALVEATRRTPAWDAQFRQRGGDLVSAAAADGVAGVRRLLDRYLQRDRRSRAGQRRARRERARATERTCCPMHLRPDRFREVLGPGEHPFPTQVCDPHAGAGDRAVDLPRRARPRLPDVRREDRHPQVRHAARSDVARPSRSSSTAPGSARSRCSTTRSWCR